MQKGLYLRSRQEQEGADNEEPTLHQDTTLTYLMFCTQMISLYNRYAGVTQQCIGDILKLTADLLGTLVVDGHIPRTYGKLESSVADYLVPTILYTACPSECELFQGGKHMCPKPTCSGISSSKKYRYIPLIPRLKQMFDIPELAKHLQSHVDSNVDSTYDISDIHQSAEWRRAYGPNGQFVGRPRAISLAFSSDGFQPYHHSTTTSYSVEHQGSVILNLPPSMSNPGLAFLHGLIPGKVQKY